MKFDLKKPCKGCPFLRGENGPVRLGAERCSEVMHYAIDNPGKTFPCHATVDYNDPWADDDDDAGDEGSRDLSNNEKQCAGAMIFSIKIGKPNQMTQIAGRLGMLENLDLNADVFQSEKEMLASALENLDLNADVFQSEKEMLASALPSRIHKAGK